MYYKNALGIPLLYLEFIEWYKPIPFAPKCLFMFKTNTLLPSSAIIQHAPYAVVCMDTMHQITIFNPAAENMFGYGASEILGKPIGVLMSDAAGFAAFFSVVFIWFLSVFVLGECDGFYTPEPSSGFCYACRASPGLAVPCLALPAMLTLGS